MTVLLRGLSAVTFATHPRWRDIPRFEAHLDSPEYHAAFLPYSPQLLRPLQQRWRPRPSREDLSALHLRRRRRPALPRRIRRPKQSGVDPGARRAFRPLRGLAEREPDLIPDDSDQQQHRQRADRIDERRCHVPVRGRSSRANVGVGRTDLRRTRANARSRANRRWCRAHELSPVVASRLRPEQHRVVFHP